MQSFLLLSQKARERGDMGCRKRILRGGLAGGTVGEKSAKNLRREDLTPSRFVILSRR